MSAILVYQGEPKLILPLGAAAKRKEKRNGSGYWSVSGEQHGQLCGGLCYKSTMLQWTCYGDSYGYHCLYLVVQTRSSDDQTNGEIGADQTFGTLSRKHAWCRCGSL